MNSWLVLGATTFLVLSVVCNVAAANAGDTIRATLSINGDKNYILPGRGKVMAELQPGAGLNFLAFCQAASGHPTIAFGLPPVMSERLRSIQTDADSAGVVTMGDGSSVDTVHLESTGDSILAVVPLEGDAFGRIVGRIAAGEAIDVSFITTRGDLQKFVLTVTAPPSGSVVANGLAALATTCAKP